MTDLPENRKDTSEEKLEDLFAAARKAAPQPSEDLMARVLSDAEAVCLARATQTTQAGPAARFSLSSMLDAFGGWAGAGGLAAAGLVGLWVGVAPPETLQSTLGLILAGDVLSSDPGNLWIIEDTYLPGLGG
ncbi:MAG: hypothetical protein AAGF74_03590 [Pseudomonadota bacterium]